MVIIYRGLMFVGDGSFCCFFGVRKGVCCGRKMLYTEEKIDFCGEDREEVTSNPP